MAAGAQVGDRVLADLTQAAVRQVHERSPRQHLVDPRLAAAGDDAR
jgi:hypothetical protein